jgi:colicin import membrane protein
MAKSDRPRPPRKITGKWLALALALLVEAAFVAVLVFSVTWQNRKPEPVTAELYAPPTKAPPTDVPPVVKPPPPTPPEPAPEPAPKPEPVKPPPPKPEPKASVPDAHAAEIALKARAEEERRQKDAAQRLEAQKKAEAERRDAQKARERKEAEDRRLAEEKKAQDDKRAAEARVRQQKETDALLAQADSEARAHAQKAAEDAARGRAQADWIRSIQAKIRNNVNVPPDIAGNPEAIFEVVQLPTGEIIDVQLRKGSGNRAYDDAVQRAILKSSPLPRPERPELFQRSLTLKFRPLD